jgi:hypothetical protein
MSESASDLIEQKIDQIVAAIAAGCSEDAFRELRCPVCESVLRLAVQPGMQVCTVMCRANAMHMRWHVRPKAATTPEWWSRYVVVPPPPAPAAKKKR